MLANYFFLSKLNIHSKKKYMKLVFEKKFIEAIIIKRSNRFLMNVLINDKIEVCHCPSTGTIGDIIFENIPCLLSFDDSNPKRKTHYTVEAISLDNSKNKNWIGINQVKSNKYVEFLLRNNQLNNIIEIDKNAKIQREKTIGDSKLDFLINENIYLEVKSPLISLPLKENYLTDKSIAYKSRTAKVSHERFFKHMDDLSKSLKTNQKAILLMFYMFEAIKFVPPAASKTSYISEKVSKIMSSGVEMWQVNCKFTPTYLELCDYYRFH